MSDRQDISRIQDSTVYQAGGDLTINHGLSASDVMAIVKSVVSSELAIYSQNAEKRAEERLNQFSEDLVEQLAQKVADKLNRFNEPALQFAVKEAALSFVKSGIEPDKKALIDLMIERVKVDENTTRQKLIDQALRIVPILSQECLDLLCILVFRNLQHFGPIDQILPWYKSINDVIDRVSGIRKLDIAFLSQSGCAIALPGITYSKKCCDLFLGYYDLLFRHPASYDESCAFKGKYGISVSKDGVTLRRPTSWNDETFFTFLATFSYHMDGTLSFNVTDSNLLFSTLHKVGLDYMKSDVEKLIIASPKYSQQEVKDFLIRINPSWNSAISLLDKDEICSIKLLPVGEYIGTRQLSMLLGREVPFEAFYPG